ncbi:MAG: Tim44/TimA family putative adaptor protein [Alphaproteobacteria bacterium]
MSGAFQYLDIILFASIAIFLIVKLAGVLGKRTGHEQDPRRRVQPFPVRREPAAKRGADGDNVIALPEREQPRPSVPADSPAAAGLNRIVAADPRFNPSAFLTGARAAFEMIVGAFAAGDKDTLKRLLSPAVFADFEAAIEERHRAGHTQDTSLVGIKTLEFASAELDGSDAHVAVRFVSEQVNVTKDGEGRVVDGDPNHVAEVTDIWTFSRDVRSRDPNWWLSATGAPEH